MRRGGHGVERKGKAKCKAGWQRLARCSTCPRMTLRTGTRAHRAMAQRAGRRRDDKRAGSEGGRCCRQMTQRSAIAHGAGERSDEGSKQPLGPLEPGGTGSATNLKMYEPLKATERERVQALEVLTLFQEALLRTASAGSSLALCLRQEPTLQPKGAAKHGCSEDASGFRD